MNTVDNALFYALSLLYIPYRWYRDGEVIDGNDKFWAKNGPPPSSQQIQEEDKCIVCTGLINLMRRYNGLSIPGLDGTLDEHGLIYPGTTGIWFQYLFMKDRLEPMDITKRYPRGTLLLRNFKNNEEDQGHVAVLLTDESDSISHEKIIHAYSDVDYETSLRDNITNVGIVGISQFQYSHGFDEKGYYTHICLPDNWLIQE